MIRLSKEVQPPMHAFDLIEGVSISVAQPYELTGQGLCAVECNLLFEVVEEF